MKQSTFYCEIKITYNEDIVLQQKFDYLPSLLQTACLICLSTTLPANLPHLSVY